MAHTKTNLLATGLYTVPEAAKYLRMRAGKVRRWVRGYKFCYRGAHHFSSPLFHSDLPSDDGGLTLTFADLMELHFIAMFQREGVSLPVIRTAAQRAAEVFGTDHPFAAKRFDTDGKRIFMTIENDAPAGIPRHRYIEELRKAQLVFEEAVRPFFRLLEIDRNHIVRYWPLGQKARVVLDPRRGFGQSIDAETGVPTEVLYREVSQGESAVKVAQWYQVPVKAVEAAIYYEGAYLGAA
jgi:uncharacterized protein (DUF433 family)